MQNKETNENVSKVVAEFFKSKPLAKHNGNHNRRPFHNNKNNDSSVKENASRQASGTAEGQQLQSGGDSKHISDKSEHYNKRRNRHRFYKDRYKKDMRNRDAQIDESKQESVHEDNVNNITAVLDETDNKSQAQASNESVSVEQTDAHTENEWYDPEAPVEIVGIRFKTGGKIYYFAPMSIKASKGDNVIVETARGLEFGTVQIPNSVVKIKEVVMPLKNVVRIATAEDVKRHEENNAKVDDAIRICNERIAVHNLEMKLVDVEYTFDNSKLLFYFTSEDRVDFRELVKDLAGIFKTRIELRQIGIREETKLLGGIGVCGLPYCCKTFLNDFVQVSIKMAKEQGLSLNSAKISGACGRLMCCLRYEYDTYDEEIRKTPKVDTPVLTPDGPGVICETQPLAGLCKVRLSGDEAVIKVYHRDDLKLDKAFSHANGKTEKAEDQGE